jgi:hypothetical protein
MVSEKSKTQKLNLRVRKEHKEFFEILSQNSTRSESEIITLNLLSGVDLMLCDLDENLKNLEQCLSDIDRDMRGERFLRKFNTILIKNRRECE